MVYVWEADISTPLRTFWSDHLLPLEKNHSNMPDVFPTIKGSLFLNIQKTMEKPMFQVG